jgi:arginine decarboxylase
MILGNRIPHEYFITKGKGESNAGSAGLPFETGSYDAALNDAGIENCNVIEYTSVIPTHAKLISKEEGIKRLNWGEVLEVIKAQSNGRRGTKISAAVMTTNITDPNGKNLGGFACEYSGSGTKIEAEDSLAFSIAGMIKRRGYGNIIGKTKLYKDNKTDKNYIIHPGKLFEYNFLDVKQEHGSVFVALCFISYIYPTLSSSENSQTSLISNMKKNNHKKSRKNKK